MLRTSRYYTRILRKSKKKQIFLERETLNEQSQKLTYMYSPKSNEQVILTLDNQQAKLLTNEEHSRENDKQIMNYKSLPTNFEQLAFLTSNLMNFDQDNNMENLPADNSLPLADFVNYSPALQFLLDLGVKLPDLEEYGSDTLSDGTFAHEYLHQGLSIRRKEVMAAAYKKYYFLFHLTKEGIVKTVEFLCHNLDLKYENLPTILTHSAELLEIIGQSGNDDKSRQRKNTMVEIIAYLKKIGLDHNELLSGIGSRCLIEFENIEDFDHLIYKLSKIENLEQIGRKQKQLLFKTSELAIILNKVPEILVPSLYTPNDIERTMQLVSRHLISTNHEIKCLLLNCPRELFYTRLEDDQQRVLGKLQANWKMLTFDFLLLPFDISRNLPRLLLVEHRKLKIRLHYLKRKDKLEMIYNLADLGWSEGQKSAKKDIVKNEQHVVELRKDTDFCLLIGEDFKDFRKFKEGFIL